MPLLNRNSSGSELREQFVSTVMRDGIGNFEELLTECHLSMCQDFLGEGFTESQAKEEVLKDLDEGFLRHGVEIHSFRKPTQLGIKAPEKDYQLWDSQKKLHDVIMNGTRNVLISGPAGSGKSRLLSVMAENMRVNRKNVVITAVTADLAAQHYDGISFPSLLKCSLSTRDVIFIDHGNLLPDTFLTELDVKLRQYCNKDQIFGGKRIIIAADFQQFLPYTEGFMNQEVESIEGSSLIEDFEKLELEASAMEFHVKNENFVANLENLLTETFGSMNCPHKFENRVLLAPKNCHVEFLNNEILKKYPGAIESLISLSQAVSMDGTRLLDKKLYRSDSRGLEKHRILLKPRAIIALTRNQGSLPVGTRLIYLHKTNNFLQCQVLSGLQKGQIVQVHPYQHSAIVKGVRRFKVNRKQFPVKLAFAMTIHKAQGQYFNRVGLYNMDGAFGHGQQRVALTRCRSPGGLKILRNNSRSLLHFVDGLALKE